MNASLGHFSLVLAFVLALYAVTASVVGARRGIAELVASGRYAAYLTFVVLGVATVVLVQAFISNDFSITYVAQHSSLAMPKIYTWVAFYAGNQGSLLYIALALAGLSTLAIRLAPLRVRPSMPYVTATLMGMLGFFLAVMLFLANPFATQSPAPPDGQGINPLLTHPGMFFHPPMLMAGLISSAVPFAFAIGALLAKRTGDEWVDPGRVWGIASWAILGTGLLLGSWWAYTILGWGGYWGWDPVENAGFMPFLGLTAFIHSIMVQKRRGMFRMWNIALIIIAFGLAQYGMFMNRGGSVPSVHSFAQSTLGWVFLGFLGITMTGSLCLFLWRYSSVKSAQVLESKLSREASFLVNNLLLLGIAFVVLWGVVYPLVSQLFQGVLATVGAPYYNKLAGPLFLALIFLMGVGPALPWRHATLSRALKAVLVPCIVGAGVVILLVALGITKAYALAGFGLCAFVATSILSEWSRGTRARHSNGENYPLAFLRLIGSNRPRYGGYVVHLAVLLLALGVVGSSFYRVERDVVMRPGDTTEVGSYTFTYLGTTSTTFADRVESRAHLQLLDKNGRPTRELQPWRAFYDQFNMAATRAAIRSTPAEDFYVIYGEQFDDGSASFRVLVNPMVWWMWVAGPVLLLGTVVTLWPARERALSPATIAELAKRGALPVRT